MQYDMCYSYIMCRQTLCFKLKHLDVLFDIKNSYVPYKGENVEKTIPPVKISGDLTDHEVIFSLLHAKTRFDVVCTVCIFLDW